MSRVSFCPHSYMKISHIITDRVKPTTWRGERWQVAELKRDGIRLFVCKDGSGRVTAHGRKKYIDYWPELSKNQRIADAIEFLPYNSILDGELFVGDHSMSSDVITTLKNHPDSLNYEVFAVPLLASKDKRLASYQSMRKIVVDNYPWPVPIIFQSGPTRQELLDWIADNGAEGFVLKNYGYSVWWKLKPEHTVDAIVTGFIPGQGRHTGKVGSLRCSVYDSDQLVEIANVSGMKDDVRYALSDADIGRVVEIQHDGVDKTRLRFPRFLRWRDDKPAAECTHDQLS